MPESIFPSSSRILRASKFRRFSWRSYVYAGDNIVQELKTTGGLTLKKEYINGIGTDNILAYDAQESTNQAEISFCQLRVLPYQSEFLTYGHTSIISRCTDIQTSGTGIVTNRYYYHTNHLGSVIALTNGSGNVVQNYTYDSFGKAYIISGSGTLAVIDSSMNLYGNTRLYTGREYDKELNLYYLRARYYNPETGRFISRDPIGQRDQVNLYTYVANSPIMYIDRMGLRKVLILIGPEKTIGEFSDTSEYYKQKYIKNGVKESNIITLKNIASASDFNSATRKYSNNISNIIWMTHASQTKIGVGGLINFGNISDINLINTEPVCTSQGSITLVGCNAGGGANPIAAELSNQTGVPVTAATNYVLPTTSPESQQTSENPINTVASYLVYGSMRISHERGEPTLLFGIGEWKTFTPNYY